MGRVAVGLAVGYDQWCKNGEFSLGSLLLSYAISLPVFLSVLYFFFRATSRHWILKVRDVEGHKSRQGQGTEEERGSSWGSDPTSQWKWCSIKRFPFVRRGRWILRGRILNGSFLKVHSITLTGCWMCFQHMNFGTAGNVRSLIGEGVNLFI